VVDLLVTVISFVLIFGALVFFHELGHLVFAQRAGILCREFAIGFGPKIFSFKKKETVYTIRLFPIGGFVKMAGEDAELVELKRGQRVGLIFNSLNTVTKIVTNNFEKYANLTIIEVLYSDLEGQLIISGVDENDEEIKYKVDPKCEVITNGESIQIAPYNRQFNSKTIPQRAMAIFAGPAMNFVLAAILLFIVGLGQGVQTNKPVMGQIINKSVAEKAGLKQGDKILTVDGDKVSSWQDVVQIIRNNPGKELDFTIDRNGEQVNLSVIPDTVEQETGKEKFGRIGVYAPVEKEFLLALKMSVTQTITWTKEIAIGIGKLITGKFSLDALAGPVGIYNYTGEVAESGFYSLLTWASILSINLGIVNLLPLPALDGGRLLFFAVEAVRGKPIDRNKEGLVHFIGFALLMLLMLVVTWNDIQKFFF
jgi:regulator of sigma E protease